MSSRFSGSGFVTEVFLLGLSGGSKQAFDCVKEKRQAVGAKIQTHLDMIKESV